MRAQIKTLSQQTLIYGAGHIFARMITFLLLPLYTNVFGRGEYGVISLAYIFMGFMAVIVRYGMDSALMRHYISATRADRKAYLSTVYVSYLISTILFVLVFHLLRYRIDEAILGGEYPEFITIISLIIAFDLLWFVPTLLMRSEEKPLPYITISLLNVGLSLTLNLLLVLKFHMGIRGVLISNLVTSCFLFTITLPYVIVRIELKSISISLWKKMMKFGLPFLPAGIFAMLMELSGRYILKYMTDLNTVGLYSSGYKLGALMLLVVMGFNMGWQPFFLKTNIEKDRKRIFARIATYVMAILGFIWILLVVWVEDIIQLEIMGVTLYGEAYWASTVFVPWVALGYFFFAAYNLQLPGVFISEKTKWVALIRGLGAGSTIGLNFLFIYYFGAIGAALATCLSFMIMAIAMFLVNRSIFPIVYEWSRLVRIGIFMIMTIILFLSFDLSFNGKLLITVLYPFGLLLTGFLTKDEKQVLFNWR
ncbi:MAG: oligosaccharide flippase family protein [Candidatus Marinimicrobia bacterium]|nr:oligosaccharide flippase family protein [Candidatus Neomarinimicrobiota bacterium]